MKHGKILYGRYRVYVGKELMSIETSWDYMYTLYKEYNGARYFADAYDGTDDVEGINAKMIKKLLSYLKRL